MLRQHQSFRQVEADRYVCAASVCPHERAIGFYLYLPPSLLYADGVCGALDDCPVQDAAQVLNNSLHSVDTGVG